jgi:hypothetical protein
MAPELFEPSPALVPIVLLGRRVRVPEGETLLRQLQYLCAEVGEGRFCWNAECRECEVRLRRRAGGRVVTGLACQIKGIEGIEVVEVSPELGYRLAGLGLGGSDPSEP